MRFKTLALCTALAATTLAGTAQAQTEIQWWHSMTAVNNEWVNDLAKQFNESQKDYKIVPTYKGQYEESMTAAVAAFRAGNAPDILQVFEVKRLGNVAGCRVTEGVVRRGCGFRLIREGVVVHQGELSTLRRFKDDVKEVINGYECGMGFRNFDDIRVGDQIECFETETVAAA